MELQQIIITIMGFLITIIGYFLKRVMDEHDKTKDMAIKNQAKLDLVENNHNHLNNRIDLLYDALKDLTSEIKTLGKEIAKKRDI